MNENDGDSTDQASHDPPESLPDETSLFTRRAALKLGVFSIAVGAGATETVAPVSANSDGYGLGGYGEGLYGDPTSLTVETDAPTGIDGTVITFNGTLSALSDAPSADVYFEWGKAGDNLSNTTTAQVLSSTSGYSTTVDGLAPGTEYEYRTVAEDDSGNTATGTIRTVSTDSVLAVTTESPTAVDESSVTLSGTLPDLGGASSAAVYFEWGAADGSLSNVTNESSLTDTGQFDVDLTGLTPGTKYEFRAVADAADGDSAAGLTVAFSTETSVDVTTAAPTNLEAQSATLNGEIADLGGASDADVHFKWGKSGESLSNATTTQTVSSPTTFTADVTGLASETDYVYRAVAAAADGGTAAGSEVLFTTSSSDTEPAIDSYTVTEAGKNNPHATITADWSVSDADADLESVVVHVYDSDGSLLDSARSAVSGASASDSDAFSFKRVRDATFSVQIRVTDVTGNTTAQTQTVTE